MRNESKEMSIGVPAKDAFEQFVRVDYDRRQNQTNVTGFSIRVFEEVVRKLPYDLPYTFVPFNGSYDELVEQVYNKFRYSCIYTSRISTWCFIYLPIRLNILFELLSK